MGPGQHIEGTVAQEGNVDVVTQCQKPQRISQQGCEEYLPLDDGVVHKQLDEMQDHEDGDEGIEVNVKTESPLHVLLHRVHGGLHQELVGHVPETRGHHKPHPNEIHKYDIQQKFHKPREVDSQHKRESGRGYNKKSGQQN